MTSKGLLYVQPTQLITDVTGLRTSMPLLHVAISSSNRPDRLSTLVATSPLLPGNKELATDTGLPATTFHPRHFFQHAVAFVALLGGRVTIT